MDKIFQNIASAGMRRLIFRNHLSEAVGHPGDFTPFYQFFVAFCKTRLRLACQLANRAFPNLLWPHFQREAKWAWKLPSQKIKLGVVLEQRGNHLQYCLLLVRDPPKLTPFEPLLRGYVVSHPCFRTLKSSASLRVDFSFRPG